MTIQDSILKSRDITLPTKVHLVKAMVFPVVFGCETDECWIIHAFKLWCWRKHLRVPRTARRSNQSIWKKIIPEHSLEGLMLKPKLQFFVHLMRRTDSFEKTLMLGKIEVRRRRGQQRLRWLDGITDSLDRRLSKLSSWKWTERPGMLQSMGSQRVGHDWATELNWTIHSAKTRWGADCGSDYELQLHNSDLNWRKSGEPLNHSGMTSIKSLKIIQWKWQIVSRD